MIRIIKHGNEFKNIVKIMTCPGCACQFEFTQNDTIKLIGYDEGARFVSCPECRKNINLSKFAENIKDLED